MGQVKHSESDCIEALQKVNENVEGNLSIPKYRERKNSPSARTIIKRFESWNTAKEKAGLELDGHSEEKIEKAEEIYKEKEISLEKVAKKLDIPYSTLHYRIDFETRDWSEIERDEEWKRKISEAQKGEKHWNWKGGKSRKLTRIRQTPRYKKWRKQVFERDNYTCQKCGQKGGDLNAHHVKQFSKHEDHRFDIDNGKTLCKQCHKEVHR